jgi:hypothetical protein
MSCQKCIALVPATHDVMYVWRLGTDHRRSLLILAQVNGCIIINKETPGTGQAILLLYVPEIPVLACGHVLIRDFV